LALEKLLIDKEFAIHKEKKTLQGYHINEHNFCVYIYTKQELKINKWIIIKYMLYALKTHSWQCVTDNSYFICYNCLTV